MPLACRHVPLTQHVGAPHQHTAVLMRRLKLFNPVVQAAALQAEHTLCCTRSSLCCHARPASKHLQSQDACLLATAGHHAVQAGVVQQMEWNMRRVLANDTSAISTLRCLKLYLERLGCNFLDQESVQMLAGAAVKASLL